MAKTTRPKTEIDDNVPDAVAVPEPVVMAEPAALGPVESGPGEFEIPPANEPGSAPPPPVQPPISDEPKRSSGFAGMVVGGVIAAALGYGVAFYAPLSGLTGQTDTALDALTGRIAALESAPAPAAAEDTALAGRVHALESEARTASDLTPVTDAIAALDARVSALESAPRAENGSAASPDLMAAVAALQDEVDGLKGSGAAVSAEIEAAAVDAKARLAEAEAQAAQLKFEAEETARKAMAHASVSRLQAALETGAPFASALASLSGQDLPAVLTDAAETGIPSLSALEAAFPDAARAALEASLRADMGASWSERIGSFLQSTTGARSLTPREGTDPDAVLSRAEAAVKAGDLETALTELKGLPPEGQAEMAGFAAMAEQRLAAVKAVAGLSAAIEG